MNRVLPLLITLLLLLIGWEWLAKSQSGMLFILPAPSRVLAAIFERPERFLLHTRITVTEMVSGFLLAALFAVPTAHLMAVRPTWRDVLQPLFLFVQCLPMFTLAPLMVLVFGWSLIAIVVPTAMMIFFPLTLSVYKGLRAVPRAYLDFMRSNSATVWQTFCKLQLPWAAPHLFSGLRIAAAVAGVGAIAGEWAGAQQGLGVFILESRRAADLDTAFAAILSLALVSSAIYSTIVLLESYALPPRPKVVSPRGALLASLLLFLGWAPFGTVLQRGSGGVETRIVLDWLPNPNHIPIFYGIERGFFAEEGIDLQVVKVHDPGDGIPYLTSQMADLAIDYMPHALRSFSSGAEIEAIATYIDRPLNALIYRKEDDIQQVQDLSGRTIGYPTSTLNHATLNSLLRRHHVRPKELRKVSFDLCSSLGAGLVDAFYGAYWNIEGIQLQEKGVPVAAIPLAELGLPNYHELLIVAGKGSSFVEPSFLKHFQRALQRSIDEARREPKAAFHAYWVANPDKGESSKAWEEKAWEETSPLFASEQHLSAEELTLFYNWMRHEGKLVGLSLPESMPAGFKSELF